MTKEKAKREFKRHYKKAMHLKEGGAAWEREMQFCDRYLKAGMALHEKELRERYGKQDMAKKTLKDLVWLSKVWKMPLQLMILCFNDERKYYDSDAQALESLIENLAEGRAT